MPFGLYDIIVYSKNKKEHVEHIRIIFEILKNAGLIVSIRKCQWGKPSLLFLGHIVDGDGIHVNPEKIQKILTEGSPKPGSSINWTQAQDQAFDQLKKALSQTVPLQHPEPFKPFVLETDASGTNIGAVLQQDLSMDVPKLSKTEQNYSAQERELLAVIHGLKHFRGYVEGKEQLAADALSRKPNHSPQLLVTGRPETTTASTRFQQDFKMASR